MRGVGTEGAEGGSDDEVAQPMVATAYPPIIAWVTGNATERVDGEE